MTILRVLKQRAAKADVACRGFGTGNTLPMVAAGTLFVCCLILSVIIPPFQSPDEFEHVTRAYYLRNGQVRLTPTDKGSGGLIDWGLDAYMRSYSQLPYVSDRKLTQEERDVAEQIKWLGSDVFVPSPGAGYYFPAIYAPQALAFLVGEHCDLTVGSTYRLARFFATLVACLLLLAAFQLVSPSPLILAVLLLPMSLFQMASASQDGVANALTVFIIALYWRIFTSDKVTKHQLITLTSAIVILATARLHATPMVFLMLARYWTTRDKRWIWAGGIALALITAWTVYTMAVHVDPRGSGTGPSTMAKLHLYLTHPTKVARILAHTWTDENLLRFYGESFIGRLGWLDAPLTASNYWWLSIIFLALGIISIRLSSYRATWRPRTGYVLSAILSVLVIYAALMLTWTPYDSQLVLGVQGRYFVLPILLLAYAFRADDGALPPWRRIASWSILGIFFCVSVFATVNCLIARYYISEASSTPPQRTIEATQAFSKGESQLVIFDERQKRFPLHLNKLGIRFGTHARVNKGKAELRLNSIGGHTFRTIVDLETLEDNQYRYFKLDDLSYTSGTLTMLDGGGISLWQTVSQGTFQKATCLVFEIYNGEKRLTPGCPSP